MKKKILILVVSITLFLLLIVGTSLAFFSFSMEGSNKSEVVLGDIYMHYRETNTLSLSGAFPGMEYDSSNPNNYFEFTIKGINTYDEKDIWYDIILSNGDVPEGKLEENRLLATHLEFKLVEVNGEEERVIFKDISYNNFNNTLMYIAKIPKNTRKEYNKTYRLYMRISKGLHIVNEEIMASGYCNTLLCISPEDYQNAFASVKVNVTGDLNSRVMPNTMARLATGSMSFWETNIDNVKSNIKEVNFVKLDNNEIDTRYNAASIKSDLTTVEKYPIKAWLEENENDSTMYTMYIASEHEIYTPSSSNAMFYNFTNVETINFDNINTSQATTMVAMFYGLTNLKNIDLSNFDTYNVESFANTFDGCSSLEILDLSMLKFDPSKKVNIYSTFSGCTNLRILDISSFLFNVEATSFIMTFFHVGSNLSSGTYTTVYVKPDYVLNGITYSPQNWILSLEKTVDKPQGWSTSNVIVKQ